MLRKYKYDIAISVAEEDLPVAKAIAGALKAKKIRYYLYTEHLAENIGKPLLKITLDTYGSKSQYVLMITSAVFARKYWAALEGLITQTFSKGRSEYLLQLRLDDTAIDGISKNNIYLPWQDNAQEIAGIISQKISRKRKNRLQRVIIGTVAAMIITASIMFWHSVNITRAVQLTQLIPASLFKNTTLPQPPDTANKSKDTARNATNPNPGKTPTKPVTPPSPGIVEGNIKTSISPLSEKINGRKFQPVEYSEEYISLFFNSDGTLDVSGSCSIYTINATGILKGNNITLVKGNANGTLTIAQDGTTISGRITMKSNKESGCDILNYKIY